jgi:hypothetical protein
LCLRGADLVCSENYTPAQRSQHLIQEDTKVCGQYYLANCSSIDGQAAFRGEQSHHRHLEYFQSLQRQHEDGLPNSLSAEAQVEVDNDADRLELARHVQTAITEDGAKDAKRRWANDRRRLQQKRLLKYQEEWLEKRQKWKITSRGEESANDPLKEDPFHDIWELILERKLLARVMASSENLTLADRWGAIHDICSLCTQDDTVLYLPQASPVGGMCPKTTCQLKLNT